MIEQRTNEYVTIASTCLDVLRKLLRIYARLLDMGYTEELLEPDEGVDDLPLQRQWRRLVQDRKPLTERSTHSFTLYFTPGLQKPTFLAQTGKIYYRSWKTFYRNAFFVSRRGTETQTVLHGGGVKGIPIRS